MGLGSRITQSISKNLFSWFIGIEIALSLVVSFSALSAYTLSGFSTFAPIFIYFLAILTGLFIGMELPLAMRLNEQFESLKVNVSSILEKDYYGSLAGGLFFAFVGLPYLGLTYTPFLLGMINLLVAIALLNLFPHKKSYLSKNYWNTIAASVAFIIGIGAFNAKEIIFHGEQKKYADKVVYSEQSTYQKIIITEWKGHHWLYLNGNLQFSSYDEPMYHEVLVHPAVQIANKPKEILILGGGDGCAARELLKYDFIEKIKLIDLDPAMTNLAKNEDILKEINKGAMNDSKVEIINQDAFAYLENEMDFYDLIIVDLPDPRNVELSRLYSLEFYQLCKNRLRPKGAVITQAGSPYFAPRSFQCIEKTMQESGLAVLPMHNQVITMGEWGFIIGSKSLKNKNEILESLNKMNLSNIETQWLNKEAIPLLVSFGKDYFNKNKDDSIQVNRIHEPVLYRYFLDSDWSVY